MTKFVQQTTPDSKPEEHAITYLRVSSRKQLETAIEQFSSSFVQVIAW